MLNLHTQEFWTDDTFEAIADKIRRETRLVKFGFLNMYDSELKDLTTSWLGAIYPEKKKFKLFRVTSSSNTSDLAVKGEMVQRGNRSVLVIRHVLQFLPFFGMLGVLVCIYAFWFLLNKHAGLGLVWLLPALMIGGMLYSLSIYRDLKKNMTEIERLIHRPAYVLDIRKYNEVEENEDDDEHVTEE
jgi:hypothetical protein